MIIAHNLSALYTYNRFQKNNKATSTIFAKLSSGLRITNAADDAAGLAISEKLRAQIRGLEQSQRNIQDGISLMQTAEGGLANIQSPPLERLRELAVQAANDTLTIDDRENIQKEVEQIKEGIDEIANNTHFNGINLLNKEKMTPPIIVSTTTLKSVNDISWQESSIGLYYHQSADVFYQNGQYMSVGTNSLSSDVSIMVSSDGVTWTDHSPSISGELKGVTYGNGHYVAVGMNGLALTSSDGVNWTLQTTGTSENLTSIAYGDGKFVAVGTHETILSSTDGINWVEQHTGVNDYFHTVKYENNIFVAGTNNDMWSSTDGMNWTKGENIGLGGDNGSLSWDGNRFVALLFNGDIATSNDGVSWTTRSTGVVQSPSAVISYGNNIAVMEFNTPNLWVSSDDGNTWVEKQTFSTQYLSRFTLQNGQILSVGLNGGVIKAQVETITTTPPVTPIMDQRILKLQVGANTNDQFDLELTDVRTTSLGIDHINLSTRDGAEAAIPMIDEALKTVSSERSKYGAYQNRLDHAYQNALNAADNLTASESRITDIDMAKGMMELTKNQLLSQASQAMMVQANQQTNSILQLLK